MLGAHAEVPTDVLSLRHCRTPPDCCNVDTLSSFGTLRSAAGPVRMYCMCVDSRAGKARDQASADSPED